MIWMIRIYHKVQLNLTNSTAGELGWREEQVLKTPKLKMMLTPREIKNTRNRINNCRYTVGENL